MYRYSLLSQLTQSLHLSLEAILVNGLSEIRNTVIAISISELDLTDGSNEKFCSSYKLMILSNPHEIDDKCLF